MARGDNMRSEEAKRKMSVQRKGKLRKEGVSILASGHIRLYRPDYPRAPKSGYVLRSHIVWEAHYGLLPERFLIHHRNGKPSDDEIENLEALTKADHARLHKPGHGVGWRKRVRAKLIEAGN